MGSLGILVGSSWKWLQLEALTGFIHEQKKDEADTFRDRCRDQRIKIKRGIKAINQCTAANLLQSHSSQLQDG